MSNVKLGKTNIDVNKNGFGALPIQRGELKEAERILKKAYDGGITFFDTARYYTDSEKKLGHTFSNMREKVIISSKTGATSVEGFWKDLETSLGLLKSDYIDIYQFHNPDFCPRPGDESGLYDAMLEAKKQGKIRFIGITNHRLNVALEALETDLYDTLQFPFSYLATNKDIELVEKCKEKNVGFLAMKGMSGGLITNSQAAYAFMDQFDNVLPLWGIQRESELDEFLSYIDNPPGMTEEIAKLIKDDNEILSGSFCRGCGYCMPCPMDIEINNCARMSLLLRRSPSHLYLGEDWQKKMEKIPECLHCNKCMEKCPYSLNTPKLLEENYADYVEFLANYK